MAKFKALLHRLGWRVQRACLAIPQLEDWLVSLGLLTAFALLYLPFGLTSGFLTFQPQTHWSTVLGVLGGALLMPGLLEEFGFRVLLMPHPAEPMPRNLQRSLIVLSWVLFLLYHLPPWTPPFFKTPAFLLGAGLLGLLCTLSYWQSGSFYPPVMLHWLIVAVWLLVFGGLERF